MSESIKRLKLLLRETVMRANIAFPENQQDEDWFNQQFGNMSEEQRYKYMINLAATLGLGEIDEETQKQNQQALKRIHEAFSYKVRIDISKEDLDKLNPFKT